MILMIDNYDSFTYNVVQLVASLTSEEIKVVRNDAITCEEIKGLNPSHILLSPGPAHPKQSGICLDIIQEFTETPILGICLGHQAIGHVFGAKIVRQEHPMHGKVDTLIKTTEQSTLFEETPMQFTVMRYHSLYIEEQSLSDDFSITARTGDGVIQAIEHKIRPLYGVQFHPESYFSEYGTTLMQNFLKVRENDVKTDDTSTSK